MNSNVLEVILNIIGDVTFAGASDETYIEQHISLENIFTRYMLYMKSGMGLSKG